MTHLIGTISDIAKNHNGFYTATFSVTRKSGTSDLLFLELPSDTDFETISSYVNHKVYVYGEIRTKNQNSHLLVFIRALEVSLVDDSDHNQVFLDGFICKSPIHRITPSGTSITEIVLAVNSLDYTSYIPCIIWNNAHATELKKGDHLKIGGRIQSRTYTKLNDNKTTYEVSVFEINKCL